jgi:hypothetical protein
MQAAGATLFARRPINLIPHCPDCFQPGLRVLLIPDRSSVTIGVQYLYSAVVHHSSSPAVKKPKPLGSNKNIVLKMAVYRQTTSVVRWRKCERNNKRRD